MYIVAAMPAARKLASDLTLGYAEGNGIVRRRDLTRIAKGLAVGRCVAVLLAAFPALAYAEAASPSKPPIAIVSPSPGPAAAGPCVQGGLAAITNRPGVGRAVSVDGSPCTVPAGRVVFEAGYRHQATTAGATSRLATFPSPVVRVGIAGSNEIVLSPSLIYSRRTGANLGGTFVPASGMQDAGIGFKHSVRDLPWIQDAIESFVTVPTGYPSGPSGFSLGVPTYLLGYSASFGLNARIGLTTTQNFSRSAGTTGSGALQLYFSYQPSLGMTYAPSPTITLKAQAACDKRRDHLRPITSDEKPRLAPGSH